MTRVYERILENEFIDFICFLPIGALMLGLTALVGVIFWGIIESLIRSIKAQRHEDEE